MFTSNKNKFISKIESLFNQVVRRSDFYEININLFNEKIINIYIVDLKWNMNFRFHNQLITLSTDVNAKPDVEIQGEISDFIKSMSLGLAKKPIPAGLLKIKGDVSLIQNLQRIFVESELIFEEILSSYLGGLLTESIIGKTKNFVSGVNDLTESFVENSKIFIKEDVEMIVAQEELAEMDEDIMSLSNRVDRLEAKYQSYLSVKG